MFFRFFLVKLLFLIMAANLMAANAEALSNSKLVIAIDGLQEQRGQICLSLFASSQGFPSSGEKALQASCLSVTQTPMIVTFENLQPGSYAIAAFHDLNGDKILNRNALGIPTEVCGFSQNPRIVTGPPKFRESAILVVGTETNIEIRLRNLWGG
jgi:uncharacterized protein (DUF2141 family)